MRGIKFICIMGSGQMIAVFDTKGNQMPKFQGRVTRKKINKLNRHMNKNTVIEFWMHGIITGSIKAQKIPRRLWKEGRGIEDERATD